MSAFNFDKQCPKCQSSMTPGYPVESYGDTGGFKSLTQWADGVPHIKKGWLGEVLRVPHDRPRYVLGFCCTACGLIEQYAVDKAEMRFHATKS